MKLRNKKTGIVGELHYEPDKGYHFTVATEDPADMAIYRTLAKLNEEWEDAEESSTPESPYCPVCGHCGEIGCCGIATFLENHVRGKTDCMHEDEILDEIEELFETQKEEE